jgi:hypothetical protein
MKKFAVINNDMVSNIIIADSIEDAELATNASCVEYTDSDYVYIGQKYTENGFEPIVQQSINTNSKEK